MRNENSNDFFYFAEQTSSIDPKTFEYQKKGDASTWWLAFRADMHFFDVLNRNNRGYLLDNTKECIFSPKNVDMMKRNAWFGEADHPFAELQNTQLSEKRIKKVLWSNRSHKLKDPIFTSEKMSMQIETCSGTDVGRGFANDIIQGLIPAFSCRSTGQLKIINAKPIVVMSMIVTYDQVPFAGFEGAQMTTDPKIGSAMITESGEDTPTTMWVNHDAQIPISSLLNDLSKDDEKVYAYLESTDGDIAVEGLTDDGKLHIRQSGLHIYAGINEKSVEMVKDFYRSFN